VPQRSEISSDKVTGRYEEARLPERMVEPRPHSLLESSTSSHEHVPQAPGEDGMTASMNDRPISYVGAARQKSDPRHLRASTMPDRPGSHSAVNDKPHRARNITLEHVRNRDPKVLPPKRILGIAVPRSTPGTGDTLEVVDVLEQRIQDLEQKIERKDKLIQKLEGDSSAHAKTIEELEDQLTQRESQIAAIQGQHFETLRGQGRNMAKDDEVVRSALQSCITGWRVWAKKYALKDIADLSEIRHLLKSHLASNNAKFNREQALRMNFMLLNAELSKFISDRIIRCSFLCIEELNLAGSIDISLAFQTIYRKLLHGKNCRLSFIQIRLNLRQKIMVKRASGDQILSGYWKTLRVPQATPKR